MSKPVISVENLSKSYRLGQIGTGTFSRDLQVWWARTRGKPNPLLKIGQVDHGNQAGETIWALKDVTFQVEQGEVLGVIGKNGAGKSTLLKILSRVTAPTSGKVKVKGRIASLLEVGTGFHPELTGRENIYLNGAILGMTTDEVRRKFDEIVDFAGIEQFIDTPVKRYSSGMYVRLAFAVAAHLESEILLVDEVLAVGDAEFQKKCLGKMGDVASKEGRTVLFVSHNMGAVKKLCDKSVILKQGIITNIGSTMDVITEYLDFGNQNTIIVRYPNGDSYNDNKSFLLMGYKITSMDGVVTNDIDITKPFFIEIEYRIIKKTSPMRVVFVLSTINGEDIFTSVDNVNNYWALAHREPGLYVSRCKIPSNFLQPGRYSIRVSADIPFKEVLYKSENYLTFNVIQTGGISGRYLERWPGVICPELEWDVSS